MRAYYPSDARPVAPSSTRGWLVSGLLFPFCAYYLLNLGEFNFMGDISVLLYGVGRAAFSYLGEPIVYLGGALAQIAIPGALVAFFFLHRYAFGLQIFLCWMGQNLVHLSLQIAKPNLIHAGMTGHEDWEQLLALAGVPEYAFYLGALLFALAAIAFMAALLTPVVIRS